MDLQSRKIEFVQEFLKLQSEEAISRLEKLLKKEKKLTQSDDVQPMTVEQFNTRIDKSMEDSKKGKLTETNDLIADIEKWS
jgi:hypothetical protein